MKPLQYCVSVILNNMEEHPEDKKVFLKLKTLDFVNPPPIKKSRDKTLGELNHIVRCHPENANSSDDHIVRDSDPAKFRKATLQRNKAVRKALTDNRIQLFSGERIKNLLQDSIFMQLTDSQKKRVYEKVKVQIEKKAV